MRRVVVRVTIGYGVTRRGRDRFKEIACANPACCPSATRRNSGGHDLGRRYEGAVSVAHSTRQVSDSPELTTYKADGAAPRIAK